jgi:hypothetical protein
LNVSRIDTKHVLDETGAANVTTLPHEPVSFVVETEGGQLMLTHCAVANVAESNAVPRAANLIFMKCVFWFGKAKIQRIFRCGSDNPQLARFFLDSRSYGKTQHYFSVC